MTASALGWLPDCPDCSQPSEPVRHAPQLLFSCREAYAAEMAKLPLPVDEAALEQAHQAAEAAASARWEREKFGGSRTTGAGTLRDALAGAIEKEHE